MVVDPVTKAVATPCIPVRDNATDDTCVALVGSGAAGVQQCHQSFAACAKHRVKGDCDVHQQGKCRWVRGLCQPT